MESRGRLASKWPVLQEPAYLHSSWNLLKGFLVFLSIIDIMSVAGRSLVAPACPTPTSVMTPPWQMGESDAALYSEDTSVTGRTLSLKLMVETLISSLKPTGNIVLICCAFFIIFGILTVQIFKGKVHHCLGMDTRNITNRSDHMTANYRWVHRITNTSSSTWLGAGPSHFLRAHSGGQ
ncbi:hypothetical protein P7K49_029799, partial [Saguinus oedipus]